MGKKIFSVPVQDKNTENQRKAFLELFDMLDESDRECIIYQIKGILMRDKYTKKRNIKERLISGGKNYE